MKELIAALTGSVLLTIFLAGTVPVPAGTGKQTACNIIHDHGDKFTGAGGMLIITGIIGGSITCLHRLSLLFVTVFLTGFFMLFYAAAANFLLAAWRMAKSAAWFLQNGYMLEYYSSPWTEGGCSLKRIETRKAILKIPEKWHEKPVCEIGTPDNRTHLEGVKTVIFPQDIQGIRAYAFAGSKDLEEVVFGHVGYIAPTAFEGCPMLRRVRFTESAGGLSASMEEWIGNLPKRVDVDLHRTEQGT